MQAEIELELRKRKQSGETVEYTQFQVKYFDDPVGFANDCIDWSKIKPKPGDPVAGLAPYQAEAMGKLPIEKRVSVRGPHGLGKTGFAALVVWWFVLTRDGKDWKLPTTASAWRQLTKYLWPEIHKWSRYIRWDRVGRAPIDNRFELETQSIKLTTGEAFAVASNNAALVEGAHADHILYLFDEAKEIPPETWDAAEGAFSTGDCMWLAISTPGEPNGRFYDLHRRAPGYEDWWVRHVTMEEAVRAGRMSQAWVTQREKQWGKQSAVYQNRVLGEFASSSSDGVISLSWVERSNLRWQIMNDLVEAGQASWGELDRLGVDVGRGGDPTAMARRHGRYISRIDHSDVADLMAVEGMMVGVVRGHPGCTAVVDVIGIGAGVFDRSQEEEPAVAARIAAFVASARTDRKDASGELGFSNLRSLGWWTLRELFMNDEIDVPPDDLLIGDLTAPHWRQMSGGKIQIEEKDKIKERLGRSTNDGDAVMQAFVDVVDMTSLESLDAYGKGEITVEMKKEMEVLENYGKGM